MILENSAAIDLLWVLIATILVFCKHRLILFSFFSKSFCITVMQAGFSLLEAGSVRVSS